MHRPGIFREESCHWLSENLALIRLDAQLLRLKLLRLLQGYVHIIDTVLRPNEDSFKVTNVWRAMSELDSRTKEKAQGADSSSEEGQDGAKGKKGCV